MDLKDAIAQRHSVREYRTDPVPQDLRDQLEGVCREAAAADDVRLSLVWDDPDAFGGVLPGYGSFEGVRNYMVCAGRGQHLEERLGHAGELVVLTAQTLGLNSCWVAATYKRGHVRQIVPGDDRLVCVVALGYGMTQGSTHRVRPIEDLCRVEGQAPSWFEDGMWAAQLAPTAMNQQRFRITYRGGTVEARALPGPYTDLDLGIVKRHFEIGAGEEHVAWA